MSELPKILKYAQSHEWVRLEDDDIVRVGITDFAQDELGDLVFVELPEPGKQVTAGEACAVIESVKTASDLNSPVSGEIISVNERLNDEPELINEACYDHWIFCVKAANVTEMDELLDADAYQAIIENGA